VLKGLFLFIFINLLNFAVQAQIKSDGVNSFADSTLIKSNKEVYIDNIFVVGNAKTREEIILRELQIYKGSIHKLADLHEKMVLDQRKVFNTRLFLSVEFNLLELDEQKVLLVIKVVERWYILPVPFVSLADRNFNDWIVNQGGDLKRISYGLRTFHDNFTGRNDKLRINIQQGFTRRYDIQYRLPYIDKTQKHGISVSALFARNNIVGTQTIDHVQRFVDFRETAREIFSTGITYTFRPSFYSFHDFSLRYSNTKVLDSIAEINPNYLGPNGQTSQRHFYAAYQFRRDFRDIIAYPLSGSLLNLQVEKYGLGIFDEINHTEVTASYAKFYDLGKGYYLSGFASAKAYFGAEQPYNRFIALGFRQFYVRGYELDLIEGQQYLLQKTTLKKRLISSKYTLPKPFHRTPFSTIPFAFYLKGFVDSGVVNNQLFYPANQRLINRYLLGYGMGLDFVTFYDVVFRLEYSLNNTGRKGLYLNFRADF
jgi:outer membrane protein assembly factor BamA